MGIADDILRKGHKAPSKPARENPSVAEGVLSESELANSVTLNKQPHLGNAEQAGSRRGQLVNVDQIAGTSLDVPIGDAPIGSEVAQVVRPIIRRKTFIESLIPLAANGVFTGNIYDTELDGTQYVILTVVANQQSAASGVVIQESDDFNDPALLRSAAVFQYTGASAIQRIGTFIKCRYWRVRYTNGATIQASFKLYSNAFNFPPAGYEVFGTGPTNGGFSYLNPVILSQPGAAIADNQIDVNFLSSTNDPNSPLIVSEMVYGGAFSGTTDAARRGWSKRRTPTIFKGLSTGATGSTAIWTPGASNKFRLLKFKIQVSGQATFGAAAALTIKLLDAAIDLQLTHVIFVPAAAVNGALFDSGWIELGDFGIQSAVAGNALNLNLSAALTTGVVSVIACGTEE